MAIDFTCEDCGKKYQVNDALAGKRGRCKACGHEFRIPMPGAGPTDIYGLNESESSEPEAEPVAAAPISRRKGFAPLGKAAASPAKSKQVDADNQEQFRKVGIWLLIGGVAVFILPYVGLQLRGLNRLSENAQAAGGVLMIALGALLTGVSYTRRPMRSVWIGGLGIVGLFALFVVMAGVFGKGRGDAPRPPVMPPNAAGAPRPNFGQGGPPPGFPGRPADPNLGGPPVEVTITLANAKAAREPGPGMMIKDVSFSVDYTSTNGQIPVRPATWVIESASSSAKMEGVRLSPSGGTLSGTMTVTNGDTGPFTCYLGIRKVGPGGPGYDKISNTVPMQWLGDSGLDPNQGQNPQRGGPPFGPPGGGGPPFGPPGGDGPPRGFPGRPPSMPPFGRPGGN